MAIPGNHARRRERGGTGTQKTIVRAITALVQPFSLSSAIVISGKFYMLTVFPGIQKSYTGNRLRDPLLSDSIDRIEGGDILPISPECDWRNHKTLHLMDRIGIDYFGGWRCGGWMTHMIMYTNFWPRTLQLFVAAAAVASHVDWPDVVFFHTVLTGALAVNNSRIAEYACSGFAFRFETCHH